jgi:hypothetical protein
MPRIRTVGGDDLKTRALIRTLSDSVTCLSRKWHKRGDK